MLRTTAKELAAADLLPMKIRDIVGRHIKLIGTRAPPGSRKSGVQASFTLTDRRRKRKKEQTKS